MNQKLRIVVILILVAIIIGVIFYSCETTNKSPYDQHRQAFINANINFGCKITKSPETLKDETAAKKALTESYKTFNLPVENDTEMKNILTFFQNDLEVVNEIAIATKNCK